MSVNPSINPGEGLDSMAQEREPTLLDCFLKWEAQRCDRIYLTQPYPHGRVVDYTWGEIRAEHAPLQSLHRRERNELCTIVYTSGSTGEPKGVMHSYDRMAAVVRALEVDWYGFNAHDRMLSYLPLAHLAERVMVETP